MGNCVFKAFGPEADDDQNRVKVVTSSGGIIELYAPITAKTITDEFPGYAIFRSVDNFAQPLMLNEDLHPHELYHLLPLNPYKTPIKTPSLYHQNGGLSTPYRMSLRHAYKRKKADPEVIPRYSNNKSSSNNGMWKVNLVISPEELSEIFSQGARTQELIENARTVAKCSSTGTSSVASSDQWSSVSSRWKEASVMIK